MNRKFLLTLLALIALGLLTAACGNGNGTPGAPTVNVVLNEWKVIPSVSSVVSGETTFAASNQGVLAHELVIIQTGLAADKLVVDTSTNKVDEKASSQLIDEIEEFPAGITRSKSVRLTAGKYALICNIAGHYQAGMYAPFEVR